MSHPQGTPPAGSTPQRPGGSAAAGPIDVEHELAREKKIIDRVTWRLMPFLFVCYLIAYIDRVNVGFAKALLSKDLGISHDVYGYGAGLFFLGYFLFEIPSNVMLEKVGARRWIGRIMISWGLVSMAFMFVQGKWSFYSLRVLLGVAEAGFFPGIVLYLTYWVPARHRARTSALFMMAIPVAILVGAPVSTALLKLNGLGGLHGWQWMFLIEGLPAVVLGIIALRFLTDTPEKATWLPDADRRWLSEEMARERPLRNRQHPGWKSLLNPKVLLLCAFYFLNNAATYGIFLFLPDILAQATGATGFRLSLYTMIPFAVALVGMVVIGRHSDRTGERKWHVAACALTASTGLVLAAIFQDTPALIILAFAMSQLGQRSLLAVFWAIPPVFLGGIAAAAGIAMINSLGNLGGYFGPSAVGYLRQHSSGYTGGLLVLAGVLLLEAILVSLLPMPRKGESKVV